MRIHLKIYSGNNTIPFSHQHLLVGTIHKWIGWNEQHGKMALFSFSRLEKGEASQKGLKLGKYSIFFISAHDDAMIKTLIKGIQTDPEMFNGLSVNEIVIEENPNLSEKNCFYLASPVLIKRNVGEKIKHYIFNDADANKYLKETMQNKMKVAGIDDDSFDIKFDNSYAMPSTKLIDYDGVKNRANWCPVLIKGKPETKLFIWNVGVGNSTGIGFGAIK